MAQTIRQLTLLAEARGHREAAGQVRQLAGATGQLTEAVQRDDQIRERAERRLAARERVLRAEVRALQDLERATRAHAAAMEQGLLTEERYRQNIEMERARAFAPVQRIADRSAANDDARMASGWDRLGAAGAANLANIDASRRLSEMGAAGGRAAAGVKLAAHELQQVSYNANDFFMSLLSGQPIHQAFLQQGLQTAQIFGPNVGVGAALKALGAGLLQFLLSPLNLAILAFAAAGAAASFFFDRSQKAAEKARQAAEDHRATIASLKDVYGEAASAASEYAKESERVLRLRTQINELQLKEDLKTQSKDLASRIGPNAIDDQSGTAYYSMFHSFRPFIGPIDEFMKSVDADDPNVRKLREEIDAVVAANPGDTRLLKAAADLYDLTADAEKAQSRLMAARDAIEGVNRAAGGNPLASYADGLGKLIDMVPELQRTEDFRRRAREADKALLDERARLGQLLADKKIGPADYALGVGAAVSTHADARGRIDDQRASSLPAAELRRRAFELELRSINATTDAERALIAEDRKRLDLAGDPNLTQAERQLEAERAGKLALAEATKRLVDADRERALALNEQFAGARAELAMIGQTVAAIEEERFRRERLAEITRAELQNGRAWADQQRAAVDDLARSWGALAQQAAMAKAASDALFDAQQLGRSTVERDVYARMRSMNLLQDGEIVGDGAKRVADMLRANAVTERQTQATKDLAFERAQLFRDDLEQKIAENLRSMEIAADSAFGRYVAGAMRVTEALREARDMGRSFFTSMASDMAGGTSFNEALANGAKRFRQQMAEQGAGMMFDAGWSALGSATGLDKIPGFAGKPDGSSAQRALFVQIVGGGGATGLIGAAGAGLGGAGAPAAGGLSALGGIPFAGVANSNVALTPAARVGQAFSASGASVPSLGTGVAAGVLRTSGTGNVAQLNPVFQDRLLATQNALDPYGKLSVYSGYRSFEHQQRLYAADIARNGGKPSGMVGRPGGSMHQYGEAADLYWNGRQIKPGNVDPATIAQIQAAGKANGLTFPMNTPGRHPYEPWHAEPYGGRRMGGTLTAGSPALGTTPSSVPLPPTAPNAIQPVSLQTQQFTAANENLKQFNANLNTSTTGLGTFGQGLGQFGQALGNGVSGTGAVPTNPTNVFGGLLGGALGIVGKVFGFEDGGWTGPGARGLAKGVVHGDEVVFTKDDVTRHGGVGATENLRRNPLRQVQPVMVGSGGGNVLTFSPNTTIQVGDKMAAEDKAALRRELDARDEANRRYMETAWRREAS